MATRPLAGTPGQDQVSPAQVPAYVRARRDRKTRVVQQRRGRRARARAANLGILGRADKVTHRKPYTARGMLTAELLAGAGIVALRVVADYEPQADGTLKGKIGHPQGQYGPLPILAGLIGSFWLLSFLAARGGTRGKVAVIAGGLIVLVLAMKSTGEITKTSATFSSFGKAKLPAGSWQTTGAPAGEPIAGTLATSSGSSSGITYPAKTPTSKAACEAAGGLWTSGHCFLPASKQIQSA